MGMTGQLQQNIFLGVGGKKPGLAVYDPNLHLLKRILSLPAGQSVYTIGMSDDGKLLAAGTKSGEIHRMALQPAAGDCSYKTEPLVSSILAPVLSVCFLDEGTFAVSDIAARCLLFQPGQNGPEKLPTGKRIICALFRLDDDHLAGLSTSGQLLIWNWMESEIIQIVEVPGPPEKLTALVKPVYWSEADRWIWSGRSGVIVFYSWSRNEVRAISAHARDVYAILPYKDKLLTIGIDGSVKFWQAGTDEPVGSCKGPEQIISAALWASQQSRMLMLINEAGKAGIYSWTDNEVKFVEWLNGDNFRSAVGPDMQKVESALHHQQAMCAREICVQIKERIARRELGDGLDNLHQQLIQSGYEHVSLALRGEEYRITNDIVSELQCYMKLTGLVPKKDDRSKNSLLRCARLLETVWQPEMACSIYRQLAQMCPDNNGYADSMCRVSKYASIIKDGEYVIKPDIPLPSLVQSATALNRMFTGRYVVNNTKEPIDCEVIVSADEFIKKYTQLCKNSKMPQAERADLWWIVNNKTEQVTTIILKSEDSELFSRLELEIKFLDAYLQTVLVPVVVFNAGKKTNELSIEQHNQNILKVLQRILTDDPSLRGWLKIVYGDAMRVIRQLITKAVADEDQ